jgi:SAM-dependent methyltransferase
LLVDHLLSEGFTRLSVVDISEAALQVAKARLGRAADSIEWIVADARRLALPEPVDVWHDRAVFHFQTDPADQESYLSSLRGGLRVGGHAVIATFGPNGPQRCSGLPVQRYDGDALGARLGPDFATVRVVEREHRTPSGAVQWFTYGVFRRTV